MNKHNFATNNATKKEGAMSARGRVARPKNTCYVICTLYSMLFEFATYVKI